MGKTRNAYRILVKKVLGKQQPGNSRGGEKINSSLGKFVVRV
jgi:hypothetical protein